MKRNPDASFYALELSVEPGGAREFVLFTTNNLDDVKSELNNSLGTQGAYLTLWYGREIWLRTYINGEEQAGINLLPFITYFVDGYPPIGFDEDGEPTGVPREQIRKELSEVLWKAGTNEGTSVGIRHEIDWSRLNAMPLTGNLFQPGERTLETDGEVVLGYGFNDLENGYFSAYDAQDEAEMEDTIEWEDEWREAEEAESAEDKPEE